MNKWTRIKFHPNLPLGDNGERVTACAEHIALAKNAAKEGMVLLKNDERVLPFKKGTRLALFGKGIFDYVRGGGGSGEVTTRYSRNIYDGFKQLNNHVCVEESLADFYREYVKEQYAAGNNTNWIVEPEVPDELCIKAQSFTDTAVIVFSRLSGESWDRSVEDEFASENSKVTSERRRIYEKGDFYLSYAETTLVEKVKKYFTKIVVVLNVCGIVDTEWFFADEQIQSVLVSWLGGIEGGLAAAELLCGLGNPSGKLADTFAKHLADYPSTKGFHESDNYVDYTEDIFVGYRYFETIPGAAEYVNYPFGYGLSYTDFNWSVVSAEAVDEKIKIKIRITNIGEYAGKEVLQVYANAPQGLLGKPKKVLMAFQKTNLLLPKEEQLITLQFAINGMASYDDLGKIVKSAYLLEKGEYTFHVGNNVRDTIKIDFSYVVEQDEVVEQLSSRIVPTSLSKRLMSDGNYEELPQGEANDPDYTALEPMDYVSKWAGEMPAVRAIGRIPRRTRERKESLNFNYVAEGKQSLGEFVAQLSNEELAHLLGGQPNVGVANTWGFGNMPEFNIPNVMTADGPAGLRIKPECGIYTTAFPCATLLACTWNPEITYAVGEAGAKEVKENNIAVWLTPAANIHRSPLCGRNFEYYSEDPLLTGIMAASMVKGIQAQNIAPSVKHFALNNKETNRKNSDSRVSERAAREIYLKAFEIIVKTANPWCIMTSYNIINGHRASENYDLLEGILREEWGFDGMICTDWWTCGEHYKEVKAGNDVMTMTVLE